MKIFYTRGSRFFDPIVASNSRSIAIASVLVSIAFQIALPSENAVAAPSEALGKVAEAVMIAEKAARARVLLESIATVFSRRKVTERVLAAMQATGRSNELKALSTALRNEGELIKLFSGKELDEMAARLTKGASPTFIVQETIYRKHAAQLKNGKLEFTGSLLTATTDPKMMVETLKAKGLKDAKLVRVPAPEVSAFNEHVIKVTIDTPEELAIMTQEFSHLDIKVANQPNFYGRTAAADVARAKQQQALRRRADGLLDGLGEVADDTAQIKTVRPPQSPSTVPAPPPDPIHTADTVPAPPPPAQASPRQSGIQPKAGAPGQGAATAAE